MLLVVSCLYGRFCCFLRWRNAYWVVMDLGRPVEVTGDFEPPRSVEACSDYCDGVQDSLYREPRTQVLCFEGIMHDQVDCGIDVTLDSGLIRRLIQS